jgi:hypothetical protein
MAIAYPRPFVPAGSIADAEVLEPEKLHRRRHPDAKRPRFEYPSKKPRDIARGFVV